MEFKLFKDISKSDVGKKFSLRGKIETVKQTSGPTLMIFNDGTQNFTFKAFKAPGERAYPEADVGDFVEVKAQINERNGGIEGEIFALRKLDKKDLANFSKKIDDIRKSKAKPTNTTFTIKSKALEALKPRFIEVATIIKAAILDGRPILLRHNADTDGYSSAITIERAILAFMDEVSGGDQLLRYQNYRRAPSKAPFYEYEDAAKDVAYYLRDKIKNNAEKPPLIVITDNGSTDEDILSIKQMKMYECPIVVVDHHFPGEIKDGKVEVDKYIDAHINPYLEGFDSNVTAGMLGYELANFIYPKNKNQVFIPAMAGIIDHSECPELDQYLELAKKEGYTLEHMKIYGEIIDMQSFYIRFNESREFVDTLFEADLNAQKDFVKMLEPELKRRYEAVYEVAKHYSEKQDFGPFYLMLFNGEYGTYRGEYPAIGKSTNHIHAQFEKELDKPVITATFGSTFLTIRASDAVKEISIPDFAKNTAKKMTYANADGGGHERAGSIKFVEYARDDIVKAFKNYLKDLAKKN
ncbi:MAG: DHH family phosphoesterase [Nanoarchaeota archaeon]